MGLIDSSLQIGKSSIMAHNLAMDVVGNNLANAATAGYTRQAVDLQSALGIRTQEGLYEGLGVTAAAIERLTDAYLEQRLRDASSDASSLQARDDMFKQLEGTFNELSTNDLSTAANNLFTALSTLQSNPEDSSVRAAVVESAKTFTESVQTLRAGINTIRGGLNDQIKDAVSSVNSIAKQIAQLNTQIAGVEAGDSKSGGANALRDKRDALMSQLANLVQTRVVDTGNGMVNVFVGADPLVMGNRSYDITTKDRTDRGVTVSDVLFAADDRLLTAKGGKIDGLIQGRDQDSVEFIDQLDKWAGAFINGFNKVYSCGQGLEGYQSLTGASGVTDPNAALNAAGLDFTPTTGTFNVTVKNAASGEEKTFLFHVDLTGTGADTTLSSLITNMNSTIGASYGDIQVTLGASNTLKIASDSSELSFSFGADTSGALAALGVNTFFAGHDSADIAVNQTVEANPNYIAAAKSDMPGDNSNVTDLLAFQQAAQDSLGGASVDSFYQGMVSTLGTRAAAVKDGYTGSQAIQSAVKSQREAVSGVSIDEETVNLIKYQGGYQAAARFISTVNNLIQVLLNM